jgi:hypothetical protein
MANPSRPFDRETLHLAFERLGQLALDAGKIVDISVYGGSALVLTTDFRVATRDVDAVFEQDRMLVRRAAAMVAGEFGWPSDWINDGEGFLSAKDTEAQAKILLHSYPAEERPGLRLFVASPSYLFAMKCLAMRPGKVNQSQDIADVRSLGSTLGIENTKPAIAAISRYYPAEKLPPKTQYGLEEIFGGPAK